MSFMDKQLLNSQDVNKLIQDHGVIIAFFGKTKEVVSKFEPSSLSENRTYHLSLGNHGTQVWWFESNENKGTIMLDVEPSKLKGKWVLN